MATLVGTPILAFVSLVNALGDCADDSDCHKGFFAHVFMPTVAIAVTVGLVVRVFVNYLASRR